MTDYFYLLIHEGVWSREEGGEALKITGNL